eukprot:246908-Prymnesium_polylepis.1
MSRATIAQRTRRRLRPRSRVKWSLKKPSSRAVQPLASGRGTSGDKRSQFASRARCGLAPWGSAGRAAPAHRVRARAWHSRGDLGISHTQ